MSGNLYAALMFSSSARRCGPAGFCCLPRSGGCSALRRFSYKNSPLAISLCSVKWKITWMRFHVKQQLVGNGWRNF